MAVSAGEVQYVDVAFNRAWLSQLVGLLVILTGLALGTSLILLVAELNL